MKIIAISDTHTLHKQIEIEECDILIHAGDFSSVGREIEIIDFIEWFDKQPARYKICIAGNHDKLLDKALYRNNKHLQMVQMMNSFKYIYYLNDSGIEIEGIKFWGSPVSPTFGIGWAFNRNEIEIKKHWDMIPYDTNVLITHGPAYGFCDMTEDMEQVGCKSLLEKVSRMPNLKFLISGHIHEAYGQKTYDGITFVNACILDVHYNVRNKPVVLNY